MAIDIQPGIKDSIITEATSYCYMYEPFLLSILESDISATKIYMDIDIIKTDTGDLVETLEKYVDYDINPSSRVNIDVMSIARQYHNSNIFKISSVDDIVDSWTVVSEYKYTFKIYSDITSATTNISKLPIIGGRIYNQYTSAVGTSIELNEMEYNGVDNSFISRWIGFPYITVQLSDPTATDSSPIISKNIENEEFTIDDTTLTIDNNIDTTDETESSDASPKNVDGMACAGMLIWKSRRGGWMNCGFSIVKEKYSSKYGSSIDVEMFETTSETDGDPFIPVNYTELDYSYTVSLKLLSLNKDQLKAVEGINFSPAIYFMRDKSGKLELMRLSSATVPLDNLNNGGDFSVSLKSISKTGITTR